MVCWFQTILRRVINSVDAEHFLYRLNSHSHLQTAVVDKICNKFCLLFSRMFKYSVQFFLTLWRLPFLNKILKITYFWVIWCEGALKMSLTLAIVTWHRILNESKVFNNFHGNSIRQVDIRANSWQCLVVLHPDPNFLLHREPGCISHRRENGRAD